MTAALVYDHGPDRGLGHRRRMEALAGALGALSIDTRLSVVPPGIAAEVVVVDAYSRRADDPGFVAARVVAAVDDLCRDLAVDVLVDPSPGARAADHRSAGVVLAGPRYALVDRDLPHRPVRPVDANVRDIVVSTGGGATARAAVAIAQQLVVLLPETTIHLAVARWRGPRPAAPIRTVVGERGLDDLLQDADMVLTGAGVTMLEALALGRPTVAIVLADNQRRAASGVEAAGAAAVATCASAAEVVRALAADPGRRAALSEAGRALVDGHGADRVARVLSERLRLPSAR